MVLDASVVVSGLADDGPGGDRVRGRLRGERLLYSPQLLDVEVASVWRRELAAGRIDDRRAAQALVDLVVLPVARVSHRPLLARMWELRDNLTPYDAAYVALAEALGMPLLTADARLAKAPGLHCEVDVIA